MDTLRAYLSTLSVPEQAAYAARAGTTIGYLRKALSTKPRLDGALVRRLDEESGGAVSRHELREDIFGAAPAVAEIKREKRTAANKSKPAHHARATPNGGGPDAEVDQQALTEQRRAA